MKKKCCYLHKKILPCVLEVTELDLFRCKKMLPVEIWGVILTYLKYNNLFNLPACSKKFCFLLHNDKKFVHRFFHSRLIVSNKDIFDRYRDLWLSFIFKLSVKLKGKFLRKHFYRLKKVFSYIMFDNLPFLIHLNNSCIDTCLIQHVFKTYKKGINYLSPSLEVDNNL